MRSDAYFKALATAKYLVNNATFPQELAKRPEQTYLNTWHGIPLKHMGFDMPGRRRALAQRHPQLPAGRLPASAPASS